MLSDLNENKVMAKRPKAYGIRQRLENYFTVITLKNTIEKHSRKINQYTRQYILWDIEKAKESGISEVNPAIRLKLMELGSELALFYLQRGNAHFTLGDFHKALSDFDRAVEIKPENAIAIYNRGCAYSAMGNYVEAASAFRKAAIIDRRLAAILKRHGLRYHYASERRNAFNAPESELGFDDKYVEAGEPIHNEGFAPA